MAEGNDALCWQVIDEVARTGPYCFVIMGFSLPKRVLDTIEEAVCENGMQCIRADAVPGAFWDSDRQHRIHTLIDRAALIVADISPQTRKGAAQKSPSENVYYEVGYAAARAKAMILLAEKGTVSPYDFGGKDLIFYERTRKGYGGLREALSLHIGTAMRSNARAKLGSFLAPGGPASSLLVVEPKAMSEGAVDSQPPQERTFGDYLGVIGIYRAFGMVFGEACVPELLTASRASEEKVHGDTNLYLIGSGKSNRFTDVYLSALQGDRHPRFSLDPHQCYGGPPHPKEYERQLCGNITSALWDGTLATPLRGDDPRSGKEEVDYGLIIRGPKPQVAVTQEVATNTDGVRLERTVTILAGAHSLGTGAACVAATSSDKIESIIGTLGDTIDVRRTDQTIWVLVRGKSSPPDYHLVPSDVEVVDAGVYAEE